jgi:hypothetical protein
VTLHAWLSLPPQNQRGIESEQKRHQAQLDENEYQGAHRIATMEACLEIDPSNCALKTSERRREAVCPKGRTKRRLLRKPVEERQRSLQWAAQQTTTSLARKFRHLGGLHGK